MPINGIHHITAVTADLAVNVRFYTHTLGQRLVARTVIQEEPETYHLFYGDRLGTPGTEMTFFHWPHVKPHRAGARNVNRTTYAAPDEAAVTWWESRLVENGIDTIREANGALAFTAPDGMPLGIVASDARVHYEHWHDGLIPEAYALRGIHSNTMGVRNLTETVDFLGEMFGYAVRAQQDNAVQMLLPGGGDNGRLLTVQQMDNMGFRGVGSVHHIALRIGGGDHIEDWRERLLSAGLDVTEVIRRHYFESIYARIPGGVLFELATDGRGFAANVDTGTLGESLTLPPFMEDKRSEIEAKLPPFPEDALYRG
ncbi:MAG: VOC family protein [Chloroflexota bacterium]